MLNDKTPLLSVNNLSFSYGNVSVLFDLSMQVYKSQVVSLLGANGAGKSTLLKVISGSYHPVKGDIKYADKLVSTLPPQKIVEMGVSFVPEGRHIFREMTVEDNLRLGAYSVKNISRVELNREYERMFNYFPILKERKKQIAGTLSGGQQQMLCIACALMSKPSLLMIDEPSLGLAPIIIKEVWKILLQLKSEGLTILLIEQNAKLALEISDYVYILKSGSFVAQGKSEELSASNLVQQAYF